MSRTPPRNRGVAGLAMLAFGLCVPVAGADEFPESIVRWVRDPASPVFQGTDEKTWDRKICERGWISVEGGTYHLWYTGYNDDLSPDRLLGHAFSPDGVRWTRDPANPVHVASWVEDVCVVRHQDTYFLFAEGRGDIAHLLTSTDLRRWTDLGPLDVRKVDGRSIDPGPFGTPTVWVEDGTWYLFYERGDRGVWLATSKDRKVWTNIQDDPVLPLGPDLYDRAAIALNQVIKREGVYYGFYHANSERPWKDWTTCVARSRDLIHWEKYSGNPIVRDNASSGILVDGPDQVRLYTMHPEVRRYRNPAVPPPARERSSGQVPEGRR